MGVKEQKLKRTRKDKVLKKEKEKPGGGVKEK